MRMKSGKALVFWPLVSLLVLADCTSKQVAVERLEPEHMPHEVIGDVVRFTLAYNQGASFSVSLGEHSRWILATLALGVLSVLMVQYRRAAPHDRTLALALALIVAGASGNLLDRLRSPRGVVDFIDIGVGDMRFWTFNLADVAVFCGAVMLAQLLIRRDRDDDLGSIPPASPT
jgi:signal peptidase II